MAHRLKRTDGRCLAAFLSLAVCVAVYAQSTNEDDLELLTKDLGVSLWDESFALRTGAGYDDNVLLDDIRVRGSAFIDNGLDATIFRLPIDNWDVNFFVTGDDYRFTRNIGVGSEDLWIGAFKVDRTFANVWQTGFTLAYSYQAQVLDLLTVEGLPPPPRGVVQISGPTNEVVPSPTPTKIIGNMISVRPFLRRSFNSNDWLELGADYTRQLYARPAYSYWSAGPKLTLGHDYGNHSGLEFSYEINDQPFDTEPRVDLNGNILTGPRLAYLDQRVQLLWRHRFASVPGLANTLRLSFDSVTDNGSGYFNYFRYAGSEQLEYAAHGWSFTALAAFQDYDYPHQTADDPELDKLYEAGFTLNLHVEKDITKWLKVFAEDEFEHTFSNDFVEEYLVNTIRGGLLWTF